MATTNVYKYPLKLAESQEVYMPQESEILCIGFDPKGNLSMWARVNRHNAMVPVPILMCGTGSDVAAGARYLETVKDGSYMWHFFTLDHPKKREEIW